VNPTGKFWVELRKKMLRQTGGALQIPSRRAVFDPHLSRLSLIGHRAELLPSAFGIPRIDRLSCAPT
jgi:hypothetical protein